MKRLLVIVSILILSIILCLGIGELAVRKFKPQITFREASIYSTDCYERSRTQPFELRKNTACRMKNYYGDFDATAHLNSLGYRGKEFPIKKPPGVKRVLILGDSMTFGIGVGDDEAYPPLVEKNLKERGITNVEVINAGYADGFSPDSYYVYLRDRGMKLEPDIIIASVFVWNDIGDLSETVWSTVNAQGLPEVITSCCRKVEDGKLQNKNIAFKYRYPMLRDSHIFLLMVDFFNKKFGWFAQPQNNVTKRDLNQGCILTPSCIETFAPEEAKFQQVLLAMKQLADQKQASFSALLLPVDLQFDTNNWRKYGTTWLPDANVPDFIQKRMEAFFSKNSIVFLDTYPVMKEHADISSLFFPNDAHLTPVGHSIVAGALSAYLFDQLPH